MLKAVESKDKARIDAAHKRDSEVMAKNDLDNFFNLYARIKDPDGWAMQQWGNDTFFQADDRCDQCMVWLKYLRDDYLHFADGGRAHWLPRMALIAVSGLRVIDFLMNRTKLMMWYPWEDHEKRAKSALPRAQDAAERLQALYPPFVDASSEGEPQESMIDMFFRLLRERRLDSPRHEGEESRTELLTHHLKRG